MSDPRQRKKDRQQQEAIKRAEYAIIEKAILRGHGAASAEFVTRPIYELRLAIMEANNLDRESWERERKYYKELKE